MTDSQTPAPEAGDEVVQPEAEQAEAAEAPESTEGQVKDQPAEDEPQGESEEEISASKKRRERRKAEMDRLHEELRSATTAKERAERELAEVKAAQSQQPPRIEDFDDHDEYLAARAAHASVRALDDRHAKHLEREAEEHDQKAQEITRRRDAEAAENWAAQSAEARLKYADFDAVTSAPDLSISPTMAQHIHLSENGADVAYFLGMNKDRAWAIAQMGPQEQAGAMRVLGDFVSASLPKPQTVSSAPDPVTPIKGQRSSATKSAEEMSMDEYVAARKAGKI